MSMKRQRGDEAGANGEFLSQHDFQGSALSQDATAMVGADLLGTDPASLQRMDRAELEEFARSLLAQCQPDSEAARRGKRARDLADKLRVVLDGVGSREEKWQGAKYIVTLILSETMFSGMTSGPRAAMRSLLRTEILSGTQPHQFKISFGSHADMMAGVPDAFDDGSYGFAMNTGQIHKCAAMFFQLDERGIMQLRSDKPDMLCFRYDQTMGDIALIIETGDEEESTVGSISFVQLVLMTCYGVNMPEGFEPSLIQARQSANAAWKDVPTTALSMSREFCWPKMDLQLASSLFSQADTTTGRTIGTKRTNVCVWLVAWVFMMKSKSVKSGTAGEMAGKITLKLRQNEAAKIYGVWPNR